MRAPAKAGEGIIVISLVLMIRDLLPHQRCAGVLDRKDDVYLAG